MTEAIKDLIDEANRYLACVDQVFAALDVNVDEIEINVRRSDGSVLSSVNLGLATYNLRQAIRYAIEETSR